MSGAASASSGSTSARDCHARPRRVRVGVFGDGRDQTMRVQPAGGTVAENLVGGVPAEEGGRVGETLPEAGRPQSAASPTTAAMNRRVRG